MLNPLGLVSLVVNLGNNCATQPLLPPFRYSAAAAGSRARARLAGVVRYRPGDARGKAPMTRRALKSHAGRSHTLN